MSQTKSVFFYSAALLAALSWVVLARPAAAASTFLDINFDSQNNGDPVATTTPGTSPNTIYSTGGFPDNPPYTGSDTITSTNGFTKGALMSTNQDGTGANFMDTQFLVAGDVITFDFDLNILTTPLTGIPQAVTNAPNGQAFVIQAFALDSGRVFRFVASPTSATGGEFAMRNNTDGDVIPFATYNLGDTHHFSIISNYVTDMVSVLMDNTLVANVGFVTPQSPSGGMEEFFIFQNGVEGVDNQVVIDNLYATVPEPSSIALAVVGVVGLVGCVRRARRPAAT